MKKYIVAVLAAVVVAAGLVCFALVGRNPSEKALKGLVDRTCGKGASRMIEIVVDSDAAVEGESFIIGASKDGRKPRIVGSTVSAASAGLGWYLNHFLHVGLSWNNLTTDITSMKLPVPSEPMVRTTDEQMRYYLNYCTFSYSCAFWNWDRWQKEIDWMALHGVNMPLMIVGADCVWKGILEELGYDRGEIDAFIAGPGFQAWWLMDNLEGWGGPNPDWWYERESKLSSRMLARMRELGMEPVLPGYAGTLPSNISEKLGWDVVDQHKWCYHFQRPAFQVPTDPHFAEMAEIYYRHLGNVMGTSKYYSMDPFHEGGRVRGLDVSAAYKAIDDAMHEAVPGSKWVLQGWGDNPMPAALEGVPHGDFVVLDLFSDGNPKWRDGFDGHDWLFCMLHNFGGRTGIHGRLMSMMEQYFEAKEKCHGTLKGVGATPEGIETNAVLYDALYELPWLRADEVDGWLDGYVESRYGVDDENLKASWKIVAETALACPTGQQGTSEPIVCARPALEVESVSSWSTSALYYDPDTLAVALALLREGASSVDSPVGKANVSYDIADLARQVETDACIGTLAGIKAAYEAGDMDAYDALVDKFLLVIMSIDDELSSQENMTYSYHAAMAESVCDEVRGTTQADRDWMVWNLRTQITTWGPEDAANAGQLRDYSNREWSGMLRHYCYPRWKLFFERLRAGDPVPTEHEWYEMETTLDII